MVAYPWAKAVAAAEAAGRADWAIPLATGWPQALRPRTPAPPRVPDAPAPAADVVLEDDARVAGVRLADHAAPGPDRARHRARAVAGDRLHARRGPRWTRLSVRDCELERCSLANLLAVDAGMTRARLADCRLTGLAWAGGTLEDVTFAGCHLDLATFRHARLHRVVFADCVLREADFLEARGRSVRFERCDFTGASFSGASFETTELRGCTLDGIAGVDGLRGAALEWSAIIGLAGALAGALGLRVLDDDA